MSFCATRSLVDPTMFYTNPVIIYIACPCYRCTSTYRVYWLYDDLCLTPCKHFITLARCCTWSLLSVRNAWVRPDQTKPAQICVRHQLLMRMRAAFSVCHVTGECEFFFLDALSKSINYACAVKNDTPIMCTVGSLVQTGYEPWRERVVMKSLTKKLWGTAMDIVM